MTVFAAVAASAVTRSETAAEETCPVSVMVSLPPCTWTRSPGKVSSISLCTGSEFMSTVTVKSSRSPALLQMMRVVVPAALPLITTSRVLTATASITSGFATEIRTMSSGCSSTSERPTTVRISFGCPPDRAGPCASAAPADSNTSHAMAIQRTGIFCLPRAVTLRTRAPLADMKFSPVDGLYRLHAFFVSPYQLNLGRRGRRRNAGRFGRGHDLRHRQDGARARLGAHLAGLHRAGENLRGPRPVSAGLLFVRIVAQCQLNFAFARRQGENFTLLRCHQEGYHGHVFGLAFGVRLNILSG